MTYTFIAVCALALLEPYIKINQRKLIYILACLPCLFLVTCYSKETFSDTQRYCRYFEIFNENGFIYSLMHYNKEPGYILLNIVIGVFTSDANLLIPVMGVIILIPILYVFYKESEYPVLSLALFIAFGSLRSCVLLWRQGIAIAISFVAMRFIYERNFKRYLLYILIAATFHITALICLPFYFVSNIKIKYRILPISAIVSVAVYAASSFILSLANKLLLNQYSEAEKGGITLLITLWVIIITIFLLFDISKINEQKSKVLFWAIIISTAIIQPLALKTSVATRLAGYFRFGIPLIVPSICKNILFNKKNNMTAVILFPFLSLIMWLVYTKTSRTGFILRESTYYFKIFTAAIFASVIPSLFIHFSSRKKN